MHFIHMLTTSLPILCFFIVSSELSQFFYQFYLPGAVAEMVTKQNFCHVGNTKIWVYDFGLCLLKDEKT